MWIGPGIVGGFIGAWIYDTAGGRSYVRGLAVSCLLVVFARLQIELLIELYGSARSACALITGGL